MKNTALITGASSGIGRELAKIHGEKGGDLILVARSIDKLNSLKKELEQKHKVQVRVIGKDLSQPGSGSEIFAEVTGAGIEVDYLINNAGFGGQGKFHERAWEQDLSMINLNIVALTELTRMFLPGMVKRNRGKILNVSSTASLMPGPLQAVYFATKAYVTSFSNAIASELSDTKITVTALLPGATDTGFAKTSGMDKTELFEKTFGPREVAEAGYEGMMEGKLDVMAGVTFAQRMMFSFIPLTPKRLAMKQVKAMQEVKK